MGDLFKALTSGLAQFVYAWLLPSSLVCGLYASVILGNAKSQFRVEPGVVVGSALFVLATLSLSVTFAYASRPLYRLLEGYTLPARMKKRLTRRQRREFIKLSVLADSVNPILRASATEKLKLYPESIADIMPTRMGNALKSMEKYGVSRFGIDTQTFWYELQALAIDDVRKSTQDTRAAVDFFVCSLAHLSLLAVLCVASIPIVNEVWIALALGGLCLLLIPPCYSQAVMNILEWRWSVQALLHLTRGEFAKRLQISVPEDPAAERQMWSALTDYVHFGRDDDYLKVFTRSRGKGDLHLPPDPGPVHSKM